MRARLAALIPLAILWLASLALPAGAAAHPLGNFTINRYARLELQPGLVRVSYVLDMAEIPTYQDVALIHSGPGLPTPPEQRAYLAGMVERLRSGLSADLDGQPLQFALEAGSEQISYPMGQGNLPTTRVVAWFRAPLPPVAGGASARLTFRDSNFDDRLGWREVVVRPRAGVRIDRSSAPSVDQSDELRSYPQDMLSSPLDVRSAQVAYSVAPGLGLDGPLTIQARGRAGGWLQSATDAFTGLVSRPALSLRFVLFVLLAAAALGGVHALSPGHGKTIVAAYLVGARGTPRHALILGLTVTVTHTAGVFALGLVTLGASRFVAPERLYPWLSVTSGAMVAALGGWLFVRRLQAARATHARPHTHAGQEDRGEQDGHAHNGHDGHDGHARTHAVGHDHGTGWHTHEVPAPTRASLAGLIALGISGGLLPCPSALVVLLAAISLQRVGFGIVLVLAFSAGLAGVLTGIGLLLVFGRRACARLRLEYGAGRFLPAASAFVVLLLGLAITLQALVQVGVIAVSVA